MKVLLLLAGQSTRFWPLSEKSLFPICGKTVLHHQLDCLRRAGLRDIMLVGGEHNKKKIQELFPQLPFIQQKTLALGMQGALLSSLPHLKKGPFMVVSGNDVIEPSGYKALIASASIKGVDGSILAKKVDRYFPGGYLTLNGNRITNVVEKPGDANKPSDWVNIVAHVHNNPDLLLKILKNTKTSRDDAYEVALSTLFKEHHYRAGLYKGWWQPIKYPWHLLDLLPYLLHDVSVQQIHKTAVIHPTATVEGNVILEKGVRVFAHASIVGPCFIGKGSIVANNALVRESSVGEECVIGYSTEVARSVLHNTVWTHKNYIGDSIIGENVAFGAGTILGNFRLDEDTVYSLVKGERLSTYRKKMGAVIGNDTRIGIKVGVNPGIKIGGATFVSGGGFVTEDIPSETFVSWEKGTMKMVKNKSRISNKRNFG
ncbi:NTP transferase domain-containing protein [Candidatus Peregrinibacteria bacterium]|nr:NTP transferase domain-containing protein [Candidatus Peregrinibacteria bacterium]